MTISVRAPTLHMGTHCLLPSPARSFSLSPCLPSSLSCPSLVALALSFSSPDCVPVAKYYLPVLCVLPARDIVIDFGKYKGSKMGTLPSNYLRWLSRELSQGRSRVWAEYAGEVLKDPYYIDRLEWESIEKNVIKSDLRRGRPPAGDTDSLGSMKALGWNLEDRAGWSKVNFPALGTTLGGRIPRMDLANPMVSVQNIRKNVSEKRVSDNRLQQDDAQVSESLSLREELLRRRLLRRERVAATLPTKAPAKKANSVFPGRDALFEKSKNTLDQRK